MTDTVSKGKILIVEPDDDLRLSLVLYLTEQGYEVVSMADGTTALKVIKQQSIPSVILLEYELPDINSFRVVNEIRDSPRTEHIGIIFLIERHNQALERTYENVHLEDDILSKPFSFKHLEWRIQWRLEQRRHDGLA